MVSDSPAQEGPASEEEPSVIFIAFEGTDLDSINYALLADVTGVPTTFFFDGKGAYLGGVVGSAEKSTWEELVNELLEI